MCVHVLKSEYIEIVKSLNEAGDNVNHTTKVVKIKHHYLGPKFSHVGFISVQ